MVTSRRELEEAGFTGFVPFSELPTADVPEGPGVYAVVRAGGTAPTYLDANPSGRHKGRNPSVTAEKHQAAWVEAVEVVYIGKATAGSTGKWGLRKRLEEYRRHGAGEPVGHWGGRYI